MRTRTLYRSSWKSLRFLLLSAPVWCLCSGCSVELNEGRVVCAQPSPAGSAHAWGRTVAVTPAEGHAWHELIRNPFREYGIPPVSAQELRKRYGLPTQGDMAEGKDRIEYLLESGKLWLQLDRDKSGSAVHETWRLRFEPHESPLLHEVVQREVLDCIAGLLRESFDLVVLDEKTHVPRVSASVRGQMVLRLTWMNLAR